MIQRIGFDGLNHSCFEWILDLWIQERRKDRLGRNSVLKSINKYVVEVSHQTEDDDNKYIVLQLTIYEVI